jgi:signal peptide peptidase SppA
MRYSDMLAWADGHPWAIDHVAARGLPDMIARRMSGQLPPATERTPAARQGGRDRKGKPAADGPVVSIVPLVGVMIPRADEIDELFGFVGTAQVGRWVDAAAADPEIDAIILYTDSPGGSVQGTAELAGKVAAAAKRKKLTAFVDATAASAAYYVASQASELVVTPSGWVGSIGVVMTHVDRSQQLANAGIKLTHVATSEKKQHGVSSGVLSAVGRAEMEEIVAGYFEQFVRAAAGGRRTSAAAVKSQLGDGGMVLAADAVRRGMADRLATFDELLGVYGLHTSHLLRAEAGVIAPVAVSGTRTPAKPTPTPTPTPAGKAADLDMEVRRRKMRLAIAGGAVHRQEATPAPPAKPTPAGPTPVDLAKLAGVTAGWPTDGRTDATDRTTCLHEAGHCVATLALGGAVVFATSNPEPDGRGGWLSAGSMQDRGLAGLDRLTMLAAGVVADGVTSFGGTDLEFANKIDPERALRSKAFERARSIINANRPAVERLATALASKRVMSGDEVAAVVGTVHLPYAAR